MGRMASAPQIAQDFPTMQNASMATASRGAEKRRARRPRSQIRLLPPRPPRTDLERACRIALLEVEGPVSVEAIYDRIVRRGSLMFSGYKRPFLAISSAMSTLVRRGEAMLGGTREQMVVPGRPYQRLWYRSNRGESRSA